VAEGRDGDDSRAIHPAPHRLHGNVEVGSDLGVAQIAPASDPDDVTLELGWDFFGTLTSFLQDLVPQMKCQPVLQQSRPVGTSCRLGMLLSGPLRCPKEVARTSVGQGRGSPSPSTARSSPPPARGSPCSTLAASASALNDSAAAPSRPPTATPRQYQQKPASASDPPPRSAVDIRITPPPGSPTKTVDLRNIGINRLIRVGGPCRWS
jgi:hypothetical protein